MRRAPPVFHLADRKLVVGHGGRKIGIDQTKDIGRWHGLGRYQRSVVNLGDQFLHRFGIGGTTGGVLIFPANIERKVVAFGPHRKTVKGHEALLIGPSVVIDEGLPKVQRVIDRRTVNVHVSGVDIPNLGPGCCPSRLQPKLQCQGLKNLPCFFVLGRILQLRVGFLQNLQTAGARPRPHIQVG